MPKSKKRKTAHPHHDHNPQMDTNRPWIAQPSNRGPIDHTQQTAAALTKNFQRRGA